MFERMSCQLVLRYRSVELLKLNDPKKMLRENLIPKLLVIPMLSSEVGNSFPSKAFGMKISEQMFESNTSVSFCWYLCMGKKLVGEKPWPSAWWFHPGVDDWRLKEGFMEELHKTHHRITLKILSRSYQTLKGLRDVFLLMFDVRYDIYNLWFLTAEPIIQEKYVTQRFFVGIFQATHLPGSRFHRQSNSVLLGAMERRIPNLSAKRTKDT